MIFWHLVAAVLAAVLAAVGADAGTPLTVTGHEPASVDDTCDPGPPPARSRGPPTLTVPVAGRRGSPARAPVPSTTTRSPPPTTPGLNKPAAQQSRSPNASSSGTPTPSTPQRFTIE